MVPDHFNFLFLETTVVKGTNKPLFKTVFHWSKDYHFPDKIGPWTIVLKKRFVEHFFHWNSSSVSTVKKEAVRRPLVFLERIHDRYRFFLMETVLHGTLFLLRQVVLGPLSWYRIVALEHWKWSSLVRCLARNVGLGPLFYRKHCSTFQFLFVFYCSQTAIFRCPGPENIENQWCADHENRSRVDYRPLNNMWIYSEATTFTGLCQ